MPNLPPAVPHLVLALVCIVVMVLIVGIRGAPPNFNYVRSSRSVNQRRRHLFRRSVEAEFSW